MKTRAYYIDDSGCSIEVTGYDVVRLKKKDPGKWKDVIFYSRHRNVEDRLEMYLRTSKTKSYFCYLPNQEEKLQRVGGGESIEHYLFKKALCQIKSVELRMYHRGKLNKFQINITKAIDEFKITSDGKDYYLDIYFEFVSPGTFYGIKFGNKFGLEVCNTNHVDDVKKQALKKAGIAVVEHKLSSKLKYRYKEEDSTEDKEREYMERVKSIVSFLMVNLIVDYSSPDFKAVESLMVKHKSLKAESEKLNKNIEDLNSRNDRLQRDLMESKKLNKDIENLNSRNNRLQKDLNELSISAKNDQLAINGLRNELEKYCSMGFFGFILNKVRKKG